MYSFRPQWIQRNFKPFPFEQNPFETCIRCGKCHPFRMCNSIGKQCHKCGKFGHFGRVCRSKQSTPKSNKPEKVQQRDKKRLQDYLDRKNTMRLLPFSSLSSTAFQQCLDLEDNLKTELKAIKTKYKKQCSLTKIATEAVQKQKDVMTENDELYNQLLSLMTIRNDRMKEMEEIISSYQKTCIKYEETIATLQQVRPTNKELHLASENQKLKEKKESLKTSNEGLRSSLLQIRRELLREDHRHSQPQPSVQQVPVNHGHFQTSKNYYRGNHRRY